MEITKEEVVDKIEIMEMGQIQVRKLIKILEDGNLISRSFHRYVLSPGADISDQDQKIQNIASVVWTSEVMQAWNSCAASGTL